MENSIQRQKLESKYQAKIDELHGQIEAKARELSEIEGSITRAKSSVGTAQVELNSVNAEIGQKRKELADIISAIDSGKTDMESATRGKAQEVASLKRQISSLGFSKKKLEREVKSLKGQIAKLEKEVKWYEREVAKSKRVYADLLRATEALRKEAKEAQATIMALDSKRKEVEQWVAKNGSILTRTEVNLRTLEHYAKRLQRYYDKAGIKIDVLSQFNIKRDNK